MSKSKKQYQQQSNSALEFIDSCLKDAKPEDSVTLKELYHCYMGFCISEGNKRCSPQKEFRVVLENEGITVVESTKHSNLIQAFGIKYAAAYE